MTTTTLPTITHRIAYDATTRDYACYVSVGGDPEQYIGSAGSYHAGELKCVAYKRDLLESDLVIPASTLDGQCGDCGATLNAMGLCGCRDEYQDDQARYRDAEADEAPTPLNTDDTQLVAAWRAYKAGAMDWSDVQAIQAGLMPRCADHDRPAALLLNKRPACPACLDETEQVAA